MSKKSKSPPAPKYSLEDLFESTQKLYGEFGRSGFTREEVASVLGQSSASSAFDNRFYSLRETALIEEVDESDNEYEVTESFIDMQTSDRDSSTFQKAAREALENASIFEELLSVYEGKLPSQENVTKRLERELGFNPDPAETVARVFEESMQFAGLLDEHNNILPIREPEDLEEDEAEAEHQEEEPDTTHKRVAPEGRLTTEIPVGDEEVVTVAYPQDLTPGDAKKVGAVLSALVGGDA